MTLWRRLNEAGGDFPRPVYIAKRRYWLERDVIDWLKQQREAHQ
jgi:predicted DNA-binding transcriptional regulator AlpA